MDSDDYGDDIDDSAFHEAATQAEQEIAPSFQSSPRPLKRRKIEQPARGAHPIPPRKQQQRRRRGPFEGSDEDLDVDDCSSVSSFQSGSIDQDDGSPQATKSRGLAARKKSRTRDLSEAKEDQSPQKETVAEKRKNRIHVPTANLDLADAFLTQPPREPSPPWKFRGAIWQKQAKSSGMIQTTLNGVNKIAAATSHGNSAPVQPVSKTKSPEGVRPHARLSKPTVSTEKSNDYNFEEDLADLPSDAFLSSPTSPQEQDDVAIISERRTKPIAPQGALRQTTLFGRQGFSDRPQSSQANKRPTYIVDQRQEPPTHHKLNHEAIKKWVYPTNLGTIRDYQFNVVARGLFHNTLVALPTGLGKTFIAATIMLNWFRWTVDAQMIFVAPTKPLVAQQIDACFNIVGIPASCTTMLTGNVPPAVRAEEWASKRVFFMTPQTLLNDLKSGYADPKRIVLLVVDEAHRATGNYAYVEVRNFLSRFNDSFRVLALTATPGANVETVQEVIDGLAISKIEIRTENSLDIRSYVHHRQVEKRVFSIDEEMQICIDLYSAALQPIVNKVSRFNIFYSNNPIDITPYGCTMARQKWIQESGRQAPQWQKAVVQAVLTILASISQATELLKYHGITPFYTKLKDFKEAQSRSKSKYQKEIADNDSFIKLMNRLSAWTKHPEFVGHPKLEYLQQAILDHFVNAEEASKQDGSAPQTRIMVFAHFRDSAEDIVRVLKRNEPIIRPRMFVGQSTTKNSEGMDQKAQLDVIEKFKAGTFNTLVATSIGEEGLDIGEVDLIICYDSKASPIRMLQRMGRTGRKREGKIIMLQMEGKEEKDAMKAKDNYEHMQELIAEGSKFSFHDETSRRILPRDVQPVVERCVVEIPTENSQRDWLPEPKRKKGKLPKRPPKKFHMPDGVVTGFVTAGNMDEEVQPKSRGKKATPVYPSEEAFQMPDLESVLLDERSVKDLERRYQTVFDEDEAPMVAELNVGAYPDRQRVLSHTHNFRSHGHATERFVTMLQNMHTMDEDRIEEMDKNKSLIDSMPEPSFVIPDSAVKPVITEDMWADDDPASQPLPITKAKPGPKPKKKATPKARQSESENLLTSTTPIRTKKAVTVTPMDKTPNWRVSALAAEGEASSPPPTDPRMRIASQADTLGSDDTLGTDEPQDTQAYRLDSDLVSFIAEDDEADEDMEDPMSSLPGLDFTGLGKGTQAVVKAAVKPKPREKLFTSDVSEDDAVVSSDSDSDIDEELPTLKIKTAAPRHTNTRVSVSDSEEGPIVPKKRQRRVIEDDDDSE